MKVRVKLLGTLPSYYAGSYESSGIEVNLPDNSTVALLANIIDLREARLGIVTVNGRLAGAHDPIPENAEVKFCQRIAGG